MTSAREALFRLLAALNGLCALRGATREQIGVGAALVLGAQLFAAILCWEWAGELRRRGDRPESES